MPDQVILYPKKFLITHLVLPLFTLLFTVLILESTKFDVWLVQHFYNSQLHQWPYRDHWLTQTVIHKGGRYLVYALGTILLVLWLGSYRSLSVLNPYSRHLAYLVVASVTGPLIITYLKSRTHIYCPWDLAMFGGSKPYVRLFDPVTPELTVGHCFPSGHSVLGFTLVSLYFFFLMVNPKYKYPGLWFGVVWGLFFGIDQQIRGAHFFSHDVFSLAVCWFSSLLLFWLFFRKQFLN